MQAAEPQGVRVLQTALRESIRVFGDARVKAAYALGSLGRDGGFSLVSDVDFALILQAPLAPQDAERVRQVGEAVRQRENGNVMAERLSVFWMADSAKELGRFPPGS